MAGTIPELEGEARQAVLHRGSNMQIIASAGSGKTEVVSQRIVDLLADGIAPDGIVAFTFTERAAQELKNRVAERTEQRLGRAALDRLTGLQIGTIHAFCFRFLQSAVPRFETFDVLDDKQLTAFVAREANRLEIRSLRGDGRLFRSISDFLRSLDVVENELLTPADVDEPFRAVLTSFYDTLGRYRLLTYGQQIAQAVLQLEDPVIAGPLHARLRHLIVDEYQDVNPAQERLIELLAGPTTELCVVGDDDQAIYQWRGSDVNNIVEFAKRYAPVRTFTVVTNWRSRPQIIRTANGFATSIPNRIDKQMHVHRPPLAGAEVVAWKAGTEEEEAGWIALFIDQLHDQGVSYRDVAILVRSRAAYRRLVDQFAAFGIPVQPAGRTGLFDQPEARVFGHTFVWLADIEWRDPYQPSRAISEADLVADYMRTFELPAGRLVGIRTVLRQWKESVSDEHRTADLIRDFYSVLAQLGVRAWNLDDPVQLNRLGTLARFSTLLADYESVRRRARPDAAAAGEQVGGQDRGAWYYRSLATHIVNYANGAYEGFDGEPDFALDAVDLTTIHKSKGLEWPAVFIPSMTGSRFPSRYTGKQLEWLVPRNAFDAGRYEGSDGDERRLFYVAMTRAREWLSISRHDRVNVQRTASSPYFDELHDWHLDPADVVVPDIEQRSDGDEPVLTISYSDLAQFLDCGMAYRLRTLLGFQPRLAIELGYGKAVHHLLRSVADWTKQRGRVPAPSELDQMLDDDFFLPAANKPAHRQLKDAARRLVLEYVDQHSNDLFRIWESERPFELRLDGVTVVGRADVILDREGGVDTALAILDYKTSVSDVSGHQLQLQVYADAGRREGLDVRAAYVHDLKSGQRAVVDVSAPAVGAAESVVEAAAVELRGRRFIAKPGPQCATCEVRAVCVSAA